MSKRTPNGKLPWQRICEKQEKKEMQVGKQLPRRKASPKRARPTPEELRWVQLTKGRTSAAIPDGQLGESRVPRDLFPLRPVESEVVENP